MTPKESLRKAKVKLTDLDDAIESAALQVPLAGAALSFLPEKRHQDCLEEILGVLEECREKTRILIESMDARIARIADPVGYSPPEPKEKPHVEVARSRAVEIIESSDRKPLIVTFQKRTTGELREMDCIYGIEPKDRKQPAKDSKVTGLIVVWDLSSAGYRSIPIEGIQSVFCDDTMYVVE